MKKFITVAIAVASLAGATAASAQSRAPYSGANGASYQCFTDDGYGRYLPCNYGGGN
jgi:hypothetical protein